MKLRSLVVTSALAAACLASVARAETITYFTDSLNTSDSTQLGRPSRSGVQQSWTGEETYTGQINTTTTYFYNTYDFSASDFIGAPFVEVSVFDETGAGDFFVSAFAGSYSPSSRGTNWLGDEGQSGNLQFFSGVPGDPRYFDIVLPVGEDLILLVNSTLGGTNGLNQAYDINVAAYADTNYDDPVPASPVAATPEPGTLLLTLTGVFGVVGLARRRLFANA
ncbi:MAG: PEP-CTERM sorting domain-containing protein [Janthinobacterium lividum]